MTGVTGELGRHEVPAVQLNKGGFSPASSDIRVPRVQAVN